MCSLKGAILTAVLLQVKTFVLYPFIMIEECSLGKCRYFSRLGNKVLTLQICLYWAAVLIPTLIALKHLMPASSMWPIGPLVSISQHTSDSSSDRTWMDVYDERWKCIQIFWKVVSKFIHLFV